MGLGCAGGGRSGLTISEDLTLNTGKRSLFWGQLLLENLLSCCMELHTCGPGAQSPASLALWLGLGLLCSKLRLCSVSCFSQRTESSSWAHVVPFLFNLLLINFHSEGMGGRIATEEVLLEKRRSSIREKAKISIAEAVSQQITGPSQQWVLSNWRHSLFDKMDLKTQVNFKNGQSLSVGDAPGTQGCAPDQGQELRCAEMALE